jgi:hypothetical protein
MPICERKEEVLNVRVVLLTEKALENGEGTLCTQ